MAPLKSLPIVQIIFSLWSFEISEGILRNQIIIIGLNSFSNQRLMYLQNYSHSLWLHVAKFIGSPKRLIKVHVQVGNDQETAPSEKKDFHSKNRGGE